MVGTSAGATDRPEPSTPGAPLLELDGLSALGDRGLKPSLISLFESTLVKS